MTPTLLQGDCFEVLQTLEADSVDSCVTDPPYGFGDGKRSGFMGKAWDRDVPSADMWREVYRVLKPGAHLLSFFGTRTYHRGAVAIEDAGFEIRDQIGWLYGSGFPKSLNISKDIDRQEQQRWLNVGKAIDTLDAGTILDAWKKNSKTANSAGLSFRSESPEAGPPTPNCDSVPATVLLRANPKRGDAVAIVAELSSVEAPHTCGDVSRSVLLDAAKAITESRDRATSAASQSASLEVMLSMPDSSALQSAWGWQGENTADNLKAVEALKTWLGKNKSSRKADTAALCAALTDDLKRITLEQSETFRGFDTIQQTECAFAISATITESTAVSLISFTVDTLRRKAIDKAAGAEREVISSYRAAVQKNNCGTSFNASSADDHGRTYATITAPATDAAKQWNGWGTALKPAWEPIVVARKPLDGTVANNVLTHGVGGLNVDGCRVGASKDVPASPKKVGASTHTVSMPGKGGTDGFNPNLGRFPANIIHDGSDEVLAEFAKYGESNGKVGMTQHGPGTNGVYGRYQRSEKSFTKDGISDTGTAARFFYTAKASKDDRNDGLWDYEHTDAADMVEREPDSAGMNSPRAGAGRTSGARNHHPTVKPISLMRYLVRLVTPKGGLVLDPFAGSGTTLIAAYREDCRAIGIELDPEYHKMASHRIENATAQMRLAL